MKKTISMILTLALALTLALSLAACGGNSNGGGSNTPPANNSTTTPPSGGDTTPATSSTADNDTASIEWPDNEYTSGLPKPTSGVVTATQEAGKSLGEPWILIAMDWTGEAAQAYVEALKAAGFTLNEKNGDQFDVDWYAENADGKNVNVIFSSSDSNSNSIRIHLPTE
jgi:hypothetical protein